MRLCDGAVFFIDALEGLQASAAPQLAQVVEEGLGLVVVLNKIDRIILELRLRPQDAYYKIKCMLDEVRRSIGLLSLSLGCGGRRPSVARNEGQGERHTSLL